MKILLSLTASILAAAAPAQPMSPAEQAWNGMARADVEAALHLIEESHPGSAHELGDRQFQSLLAAARANAAKRLPLVKDYYGHAAVLNGLANDLRDGHIWSNPILSSVRRTWAGLVISRRGGQWVVGAQEKGEKEPDLEGSRLLSCDGVEANAFARARIGTFHAHPDVEADMASLAYTLLLDDRNPFVTRPKACRFQQSNSQVIDHELAWRSIPLRKLEPIVVESIRPASAGMSLVPFAGGYWIGIESFSSEAAPVVEQVRAQQESLRSAPMVVLDLRGNGGGNSRYAVEIAEALVGHARTAAADRPAGNCSGAFWRASAGNAAALQDFVRTLPPERAGEWQEQAEALALAVRQGRSFSPDLPECAREPMQSAAPERLPPSKMKGRLILITDRACFSSCLIAADLFRRLGATHVGEATDMSTRYMEVREIVLPSGLRTFSTLQKVALGLGDFGPYEPDATYPGSLADTDRLKDWVAALPR